MSGIKVILKVPTFTSLLNLFYFFIFFNVLTGSCITTFQKQSALDEV